MSKMKIDKKRLFFIVSALVIITFVILLGARAIKHEVLSRQYQSRQLAQSRVNTISLMVQTLLEQKAVHIQAISRFIQPEKPNFNHLLDNDIDIKNVFVIDGKDEVYTSNSTQTNSSWQSLVGMIAQDPSVLFAHYIDSEQAKPKSGWYMSYDNNGPVLIYWLYNQNQLMGFQLNYIKLLLDLTLELDDHHLVDHFVIIDNGQLIYQNSPEQVLDDQSLQSISLLLNYPLKNWQIEYYFQDQNNTILYLLGIVVLTVLVGFIIVIFVYSYLEYTRTLRLARQQVSFVGQVSHEFKTPLTNITLYSEMLKERLVDEAEPVPQYIDVITQESQRLTRLIQNVLNFTKSAKLTIKKIHLNVLLNKNCLIFEPILAKKSMKLHFNPYVGDDTIVTDEDKLIQIINNLLSNAEKYAAKGQRVDLSIDRQNSHFMISIRDYGEGIANHALSMIFKPFYRLNNSLTEGVSGTGIGLTIAKQLAIQLQGDITVKNRNPGAQFTLMLPIHQDKKE